MLLCQCMDDLWLISVPLITHLAEVLSRSCGSSIIYMILTRLQKVLFAGWYGYLLVTSCNLCAWQDITMAEQAEKSI